MFFDQTYIYQLRRIPLKVYFTRCIVIFDSSAPLWGSWISECTVPSFRVELWKCDLLTLWYNAFVTCQTRSRKLLLSVSSATVGFTPSAITAQISNRAREGLELRSFIIFECVLMYFEYICTLGDNICCHLWTNCHRMQHEIHSFEKRWSANVY